MPPAEPVELQDPSGSVMADLQAGLATLGPRWGLRQLVDIDPEQARDDLARLSAAALSIVAQAGRGAAAAVPEAEVAGGENAAAQFLIRWHGEADPRHVTALDTYWVTAAEHGVNPSTFTARITASTGADCAATLSAAVGALSGPLHGGAPTRVLLMLDEVEASGDADAYVNELLDRGERIMGFGHRVYRAEDPRARVLAPDRQRARVAPGRGGRGARAGGARRAAREVSRPGARDERRVLGRGRARHRRDPARHVPGDVRLRAGRRLVGARRRAAAHRPPDPPVGALRRRAGPLGGGHLTLAEAAAQAAELAERGEERELAVMRSQWDEELEAAARSHDYRERAVAYRAISQFRFRQKIELLRRGLEDDSPACRGSALISLELLSRDHPSVINSVRPLLHELVDARRQRRRAPARGDVASQRLGRSATRSRSSRRSPRTTRRGASCATPPRRSPSSPPQSRPGEVGLPQRRACGCAAK